MNINFLIGTSSTIVLLIKNLVYFRYLINSYLFQAQHNQLDCLAPFLLFMCTLINFHSMPRMYTSMSHMFMHSSSVIYQNMVSHFFRVVDGIEYQFPKSDLLCFDRLRQSSCHMLYLRSFIYNYSDGNYTFPPQLLCLLINSFYQFVRFAVRVIDSIVTKQLSNLLANLFVTAEDASIHY